MFKDASEVISFIKENDIKMVDVRFTDLPGTQQHFSLPAITINTGMFEDGLGFDGSSVRGFQVINESDMLVFPDPTSAFVDPTLEVSTLVMVCDIKDPITGETYSRDPRNIAKKAEAFLKESGIADTCYMGPEAEFFLFTDAKYASTPNFAMFSVDSDEAWWNTSTGFTGKQIQPKRGYFPVPPADTVQDVRSKIVLAMMDIGINVEVHHHEVATAGQCEIDMRFDTLVKMADSLMNYKYLVKAVAAKLGYTATFMPKPIFGDNGSGMHTHQSLWKEGTPLFFDENGAYSNLSDMARYYIGGLLAHAPALLAFAAPTTNSYRRLVPGFEAPVNLVYSQRNRSAACRIPVYSNSPKAKRVEFRCPDPSCNPYLSFAAMLMAGIDGIINKIDPGAPTDVDLYELSPEELAEIKSVPGSLPESLAALAADNEFLMRGGVFTPDVISTYIDYKMTEEVIPVQMRPTPHEYLLYFDI
ncbi:MAG: type I glutamate--ammonia ligase [Chloroflexaceae bacterium]|nr:type I glutamate--ammonia ligase [Chloroflexaceae bacterium]NJO06044.1 type I glutamate--ammonia ligase [Chloroflexaceae bacterium]